MLQSPSADSVLAPLGALHSDEDAPPPPPAAASAPSMGLFERFLTLWVLLCMLVGALIGSQWPDAAHALDAASVSGISVVVAALLFVMIFPMALSVEWRAVLQAVRMPKGILLTCAVNWAVQPFLMFGLATLFFKVVFASALTSEEQREFVAGAVVLGGSPCTAMVFVWSALVNGSASYTLVQVAINDALILVLYAPTLFLLLDATDIAVPYDTIVVSIALYVVLPFSAAFLVRRRVLAHGGQAALDDLKRRLQPWTVVALLATLVVIFIFQGRHIVDKPLHILMIIVPLALQNYLVFVATFACAQWLALPFDIAAPAAFIASSNFFELGAGIAISGEPRVCATRLEQRKRTKEKAVVNAVFASLSLC